MPMRRHSSKLGRELAWVELKSAATDEVGVVVLVVAKRERRKLGSGQKMTRVGE